MASCGRVTPLAPPTKSQLSNRMRATIKSAIEEMMKVGPRILSVMKPMPKPTSDATRPANGAVTSVETPV
jgi:hypothetical protein